MTETAAQDRDQQDQGDGVSQGGGQGDAQEQQQGGAGDGKSGAPSAEDLTKLETSLNEERQARKAAEVKLARLEQQHMSEQDKAIAAAKAEGAAEASQAAGKRLAAAEFRAAAAGKLADPVAALEVIDLGRFVREDGEPDSKAIVSVVDKLAAALPVPPAGHVPSGPRGGPAEQDGDFIRATLNGRGQ